MDDCGASAVGYGFWRLCCVVEVEVEVGSRSADGGVSPAVSVVGILE